MVKIPLILRKYLKIWQPKEGVSRLKWESSHVCHYLQLTITYLLMNHAVFYKKKYYYIYSNMLTERELIKKYVKLH